MNSSFPSPADQPRILLWKGKAGFSLIELLVVMAIIALLVALSLPAISFINGRKFDTAVQQITSMLNLAREEARANNTYTWVLFYPSTPPGQLTIVAIESKDGTDPIAWGTYPNIVPDGTIQLLARPLTVSQINLANSQWQTFDAEVASVPSPTASASNDLAITANDTTDKFSVQMNIPTQGLVTFTRAIRYLPSNGAGNNDPSGKFIELDLQPIRGGTVDAKNVAVVRIDKASAALQLYKP
jgi:prepilin-type N-terminal cleavage/methylation domain-containing protein